MSALTTATLSGVVYDHESGLVSGATVEVLNTPLSPVTSGPDGAYSIDMPAGLSA